MTGSDAEVFRNGFNDLGAAAASELAWRLVIQLRQ
jgi:hypothetical protein